MAGFTINVDDAELEKIYNAFKKYPEVAKKAIISATNRTIQSANTELQRNITQRYNIKKKDLNGGSKYQSEKSNNLIKVKKAHGGDLTARVEVRGGSLTLYRFVKGNKMPRNKKGKGYVSVQVKKGETMKMSRYNFIQYGKGGALQMFNRRSNSRKINRLLKTTSTPQMAGNNEVMNKTQQAAQATLQKRVEHEIEYRLNKLKGGDK